MDTSVTTQIVYQSLEIYHLWKWLENCAIWKLIWTFEKVVSICQYGPWHCQSRHWKSWHVSLCVSVARLRRQTRKLNLTECTHERKSSWAQANFGLLGLEIVHKWHLSTNRDLAKSDPTCVWASQYGPFIRNRRPQSRKPEKNRPELFRLPMIC